MELSINGARYTVDAAPGRPLVYVLRDDLGLTGTKFGCGAGRCGACTVLLDDSLCAPARPPWAPLARPAGKPRPAWPLHPGRPLDGRPEQPSLGDVPLIVLSAAEPDSRARFVALHEGLAQTLSSRGRHVLVPGADHFSISAAVGELLATATKTR